MVEITNHMCEHRRKDLHGLEHARIVYVFIGNSMLRIVYVFIGNSMLKASVRDMTASLVMLRVELQSKKRVELSKELWTLFEQFDRLREEMGYSGVAVGDLTEDTEQAWKVRK